MGAGSVPGIDRLQAFIPVNHCVIGGDDTVSGDFTVGWKNIHHEGRRSLRTAEIPVGAGAVAEKSFLCDFSCHYESEYDGNGGQILTIDFRFQEFFNFDSCSL